MIRRWCSQWVLVFTCVAGVSASVLAETLPDFQRLVREHGASVVNISVSQPPSVAPAPRGLPGDNPHVPDFLRRFLPDAPQVEPDDIEQSQGSGFFISDDGYILTNAHVVGDAQSIQVRLLDRRVFVGTLVGLDRRADIALLKIDASGLPAVRLGAPDSVSVGEWVVAIGSPFGFENSVTAGIVSAKGRVFPEESFVPFIQTDVAINPGNSGGPLFNLAGEVVGINAQIFSRTGGFMGVSFAIPIDIAMDIQTQLRKAGKVERGRIGVGIQEVTAALAGAFGLSSLDGALVGSVEPDSPAQRAGVRAGDVIVRFGDQSVQRSDDLPRIVARMAPGREVPMDVLRGGERQTLQVTLGQWPEADRATAHARRPASKPAQWSRRGLDLAALAGARLKSIGAPWGLEVRKAEGPAARARVREGDVLVAAVEDGKQTPLRTLDDLDAALGRLEAQAPLVVLLQRGTARSFVAIEVP
ncbi:Do family serine endopeptidase [Denitromonas iodatirespirans]|uniref:Probable periplasmic serine endoprotease DegP-like n=1 Tax=Denitromonas iodatirespirans TaxID=2795389 RepID=A0A944DBA8_DENI1|nr:Do family serine endopeptidase [Denitromonas iodatirespirans]MBT0961393.1 Do family serine endopeptidase [Denitromonas iodatirespirans]